MIDPASATDAAVEASTVVIEGHLEPDPPDWVYVPVEVPPGTTELTVRYSYNQPEPPPGQPGNRLDIGIFDPRGHTLPDAAGFRGWSGGARDTFTISASAATPGYLPGPIRPGTWHVVLGPYTVVPTGLDYRLEVSFGRSDTGPAFVPTPAPTRATGRGRAWYRGDLHLHSVHSDGQWEPTELVAAARAAGLDFMVSTEHNTSSAAGVWGTYARNDLLIIDGEEITTRNGHIVAAGLPAGTWIDWRYRSADRTVGRYVEQVRAVGALAIAAHPHCPFVGCGLRFAPSEFDAVEVWNGPWTPDDEVALLSWDASLVTARTGAGRFRPAVGGSDSHHREQPVGLPQTVVRAEALSRDAIVAGLRAGHAYVAEHAGIDVTFTAAAAGRRADIGERLPAGPDDVVSVELTVEGVRGGIVSLITDRGALLTRPLPDTGRLAWTTRPRAAAYVRAEIRHQPSVPGLPGAMIALTNPIFLGGS